MENNVSMSVQPSSYVRRGRHHPAFQKGSESRASRVSPENTADAPAAIHTLAQEPPAIPTQPIPQAAEAPSSISPPLPPQPDVVPSSVVADIPPVRFAPPADIPLPDGYSELFKAPTTAAAPPPSPTRDYESELLDLKRQLDAARDEINKAKQIPEELRGLRDEQELQRLFSNPELGLESVSPEDAQKLLKPVFATVRKQYDESNAALRKQFEEQQQRFQAEIDRLNEQELRRNISSTQKAILSKHPDLEKFQKSQAYIDAMTKPIAPGSNLLLGHVVAAEFQRGNVDYIVKVLDSIKGAQASDIGDMVSVSPSSPGTPVEKMEVGDGYLTPDQLTNLRMQFNRREISREDFQKAMKAHRESKKRWTGE